MSRSRIPREPIKIDVLSIRYGSIELLLAVAGGEDLLSDMFWSVLEFYAPEAFNDVLHSNTPLYAAVRQRSELERQKNEPERQKNEAQRDDVKISKLDRFLAAGRAPLVAWALLILAVIYFGGMRLEAPAPPKERVP